VNFGCASLLLEMVFSPLHRHDCRPVLESSVALLQAAALTQQLQTARSTRRAAFTRTK